jgi:hypothetical protein
MICTILISHFIFFLSLSSLSIDSLRFVFVLFFLHICVRETLWYHVWKFETWVGEIGRERLGEYIESEDVLFILYVLLLLLPIWTKSFFSWFLFKWNVLANIFDKAQYTIYPHTQKHHNHNACAWSCCWGQRETSSQQPTHEGVYVYFLLYTHIISNHTYNTNTHT